MKSIIDILTALTFTASFFASVWLWLEREVYWGLVIVLVSIILYRFFDKPSTPGSRLFSLQNGGTAIMVGLIVIFGGLNFIYLGCSELYSPVNFLGSVRLWTQLVPLIRDKFGAFGVAIFLWSSGCFGIVIGIKVFRSGLKKFKLVGSK